MDVNAILKAKGSRLVVTVAPPTPITAVIDKFKSEAIGAVVVTDAEAQILGVISERSIVLGLAKHGRKLLGMQVGDLLSGAVRTCRPQDHVKTLMAEMTLHRTRHLPVVDANGELCGIVSIGDVLNYRMMETELEAGVLRDAYITHGAVGH